MKYYWINLDTALDRRVFMENQFRKLHIDNHRISAITPSTLSSILEDKPPYNCGYPDCIKNNFKDCPVEYATVCSHLKAILEGYKSNDDYFVICEDDIYFTFQINFNFITSNFPKDFDIFQMMIISEGHTEIFYQRFFLSNNLLIKYMPITPSAGFYLISRAGAKKIIDLYYNPISNKFNLSNCPYLKLADVLIFQSVHTIVSTFPLCIFNIGFKSQIHEHHYEDHKKAYNKIKELILKHYGNPLQIDNKIPFLLSYYPIEDLEKLFKS
jgi:GR25 family glycosyltransferase involved in LPS biosynthesis